MATELQVRTLHTYLEVDNGLGVGVKGVQWWYNMRTLHYKKRNIRLSDEVYAGLLKLKQKSGQTWNLTFKELLQNNKKLSPAKSSTP